MLLKGSCHCQAVTFTVECSYPYPFNLCYCSICRKTAGSGGYAINLGGQYDTLTVQGREHIQVYQAKSKNPQTGTITISPGERSFCCHCGSALWNWDPRWPELVHPFASAIDTELPESPEQTHMMLEFKASWVKIPASPHDQQFVGYPQESLSQWHERLGLIR